MFRNATTAISMNFDLQVCANHIHTIYNDIHDLLVLAQNVILVQRSGESAEWAR